MLTAGRGLRLRPLTLSLPKALLPIAGEPVAGHTLRQLGRLGCEAVVMNLHHLPEAIPRHFGASYHGLPLVYSVEEEIQGTLGALYPQRDFLRAADVVLLVNGDTYCKWPWRRMIRRHLRSGADATLLCHRRPPVPELGGAVGLAADGRIVALRDTRIAEPKSRHVFAGAHVLSARLLERIAPGPGDIVSDLYVPLLEEGGRLDAVLTRAAWQDLGTPERYLEAHLEESKRFPGKRSSRISALADVDPRAQVVGSFVDRGARVAAGAEIEDCVLLAQAEVAPGSRIERSILGPGVRLPSAARIERRMINRIRPGYQTGPRDSVMGDLIYTPIDPDRS